MARFIPLSGSSFYPQQQMFRGFLLQYKTLWCKELCAALRFWVARSEWCYEDSVLGSDDLKSYIFSSWSMTDTAPSIARWTSVSLFRHMLGARMAQQRSDLVSEGQDLLRSYGKLLLRASQLRDIFVFNSSLKPNALVAVCPKIPAVAQHSSNHARPPDTVWFRFMKAVWKNLINNFKCPTRYRLWPPIKPNHMT